MGPILSHSGLHTSIQTADYENLVQSSQYETHITMINGNVDIPIEIFSAQCSHEIVDSVLRDAVGVCFLSSTFSTIDDARSDALYLSQLFFGSEVQGIYNTDKFLPNCQKVLDSPSVQILLSTWERYFIDHPDSYLVQCFYGDGCFAVQKALELSLYRERIAVVGINSYAPITHSMCYLYRSAGHFFSGWTGSIAMPFSPYSHGAIYQNLQDPLFAPCFLHAFYEMARVSPKINHYYPKIFGEVAVVLECPQRSRFQVEQLLLSGEENISRECQWLMHGVIRTLQSRDPWSEQRLCRFVNVSFTCLRIVDYIQLLILNGRPEIEQRHTRAISDTASWGIESVSTGFNASLFETTVKALELSPSTLSTQIVYSDVIHSNSTVLPNNPWLNTAGEVIVPSLISDLFIRNANSLDYALYFFTGYWGVQALSELVLLKTDNSQHHRKIRAIALAFTSSLVIGNVLEIAYNMPLFLSQRNTEPVASIVRGGLLCCDMMWLLRGSVHLGVPPVRRMLQRIGKKLRSKISLPKVELGAIGIKHQCVRIDRTYRKQVRSANVFVKATELMFTSVLALGIASAAYVTSYDKDSIFLAVKSTIITIIMLVILYALRK